MWGSVMGIGRNPPRMPLSAGLYAEPATRTRTSPAPGTGWHVLVAQDLGTTRLVEQHCLHGRSPSVVCFGYEATAEDARPTSNQKQVLPVRSMSRLGPWPRPRAPWTPC